MVLPAPLETSVIAKVSVLALSSRFDGPGTPRTPASGKKCFSTRSVESF